MHVDPKSETHATTFQMSEEKKLNISDFPARQPPSKANIALAQRVCKSNLGVDTYEHDSTSTIGWSEKDLVQLRDSQSDETFVVKVPKSLDAQLIQSCREEGRRAKWVGDCGLGPKVYFVDLETGAFAMQLIEGAKSLTFAEELQRLPEVMALLRRFHAQDVPEWLPSWNFFDVARTDLALAKKGTLLSEEDCDLVEKVLDRAEWITTPSRYSKACHNDYWTTNILSDRDGRLWCIDFEVTGRGDPLWDIGYLASELSISAREVAIAYGLLDSHDQLQVVAYRHAAKAWLAAWCGSQSESWLSFFHECMEQVRDAYGQESW